VNAKQVARESVKLSIRGPNSRGVAAMLAKALIADKQKRDLHVVIPRGAKTP
jgi:hypothetical protein